MNWYFRSLSLLLFLNTIAVTNLVSAESTTDSAPSPANPKRNKKRGWFARFRMGNSPIARMATYSIAKNQQNAVSILEFNGKPLSWFRLDDGVMGGSSETTEASLAADGCLKFEGLINTNGGGFTSIRTKLPEGILPTETTGFKIRYRGDGKTYKVLLSNGSRGGPFSRNPSWQADIPTKSKKEGDDSWDEVLIPFESLAPSIGGASTLSEDAKKEYTLDVTEMTELGLMLSLRLSDGSPNPKETFGEGIFPFLLEIQSITTV